MKRDELIVLLIVALSPRYFAPYRQTAVPQGSTRSGLRLPLARHCQHFPE